MADLNQRYDVSRAKSEKWELILNQITLEAIDKVMETVTVKDACWKLYKDMCERLNLPAIHENDYEQQFNFIKELLYQYRSVNLMNRVMEEEKLKISEKACPSRETEAVRKK